MIGDAESPRASYDQPIEIALDREPATIHPLSIVATGGPDQSTDEHQVRLAITPSESFVGMFGWMAVSIVGLVQLCLQIANKTQVVTSVWLWLAIVGTAVSLVLVIRRRSAVEVRHLLSEAQGRYAIAERAEASTDTRRADAHLLDLLDSMSEFVGGRSASLYVTSFDQPPTLRASVGVGIDNDRAESTATACLVSGRAVTSRTPQDDQTVLLAAPLLIGDRTTGVLLVSAPRRWVRSTRLPKLRQLADSGAAVIERVRLGEDEWRSRLGIAHARGHLAILAEASMTMSKQSGSDKRTFKLLGDVLVPEFCDWFAVHLEDDAGQLSTVSVGDSIAIRRDSRASRRTPEKREGHAHPEGDALVRSAMATRCAVVSSDLAASFSEPGRKSDSEPAVSLVQAAPTDGIGSVMVVPVAVYGQAVGALSFVTFPGRRGFRPSDLEVADALANTVAVTAERALLVRQGRTLSRSAERRADRLRRLVDTALAMNTPLAESGVFQVLAENAKRMLACERVVVASRKNGFTLEVSWPDDATDVDMRVVKEATDRVLGPSSSTQRSSSMGVASFRMPEGDENGAGWVAAAVDQTNGSTRRAMVAIGPTQEPFDSDDEALLALLTRMASAALERTALYESLRSNEQRLTALVESSPLAIAELDLDGGVRWWNRTAGLLFGLEQDAPAPRRIPVAGDTASALEVLWETARGGDATVGALVQARRSDGEWMDLSLSVAPLQENDGTTSGILAVIEDATEREQVLEQFHRSQRLGAMARLAGGIAHDFSNLVTVILASSETLMKRIDPDDPMRAEVEAINRVGKRAAALTGQLLQIGQRSGLQLTETSPGEVIDAMADELRRLMGSHIDVVITNDAQGLSPVVLVDPAELERSILNLAFNARDAMPQGGRFSIRTRFVDSGAKSLVEVTVSDTGIGMDPRTAQHCFEPFFTTKGSASGTGLGLATVHAMVTQSNGSVDVESSPGTGTKFTLQFPLAAG